MRGRSSLEGETGIAKVNGWNRSERERRGDAFEECIINCEVEI
jgi:hypothetical protein